MNLIQKDSHKDETMSLIMKYLNGNKIDFLFIDGDHTYEGVKQDFEMYSPLLNKNGIIAFHDSVSNVDKHGVPRFLKQINSFNNKVLAYDILGHGKTPLTKSDINFDDFSSQLLNLINELFHTFVPCRY